MIESKNKITVPADHWLQEACSIEANSKAKDQKNPFFFDSEGLYLRYNSIRIKNLSKVDGDGAEVGYYWNGIKVCVFPVAGVALDFKGLDHSLDLNGIEGFIKMVVINGN